MTLRSCEEHEELLLCDIEFFEYKIQSAISIGIGYLLFFWYAILGCSNFSIYHFFSNLWQSELNLQVNFLWSSSLGALRIDDWTYYSQSLIPPKNHYFGTLFFVAETLAVRNHFEYFT